MIGICTRLDWVYVTDNTGTIKNPKLVVNTKSSKRGGYKGIHYGKIKRKKYRRSVNSKRGPKGQRKFIEKIILLPMT